MKDKIITALLFVAMSGVDIIAMTKKKECDLW
jgi:hypothetical protein